MKSDKSTYPEITNAAISTAIFAVIIIVTLVIFNLTEKHNSKGLAKETLIAVFDSKTKQVSDWYTDEVQDAGLISGNQSLRDLILSYMSDGTKYHLLVRFLNQIKTEHVYADVVVLSMDGKYIASTNAGLTFDDPSEMENFKAARFLDKTYVSDIYRSKNDDEQYIDFISIIKDDYDQDIACVIFKKYPVPFFNEIIATWPFQHKTAETFLVKMNKDGQLLKYINSELVKYSWVPYDSSGFNQKRVYSLNSGFVENGISDGKVVFSYTNAIPETPWGIIVEADRVEMFSGLYSKLKASIIIVIIICFLFFVTTYLFIHLKQEKIIKKSLQNDSTLFFFKEQFSLIMDMLEEGVIVSDANGLIQYMNLKAETIIGWNFSDVFGKMIDDIFKIRYEDTGFNAFSYKNWLPKDIGLTTIKDVVLIERDDRSIPVSCTITPIHSGLPGQNGVIISFHDESEKRYQEKMILNSEMRFRDLFQDAPDATVIVDREGVIRLANMQALILFGYSMNEFIGMQLERLMPEQFSNHAKYLRQYFEEPSKRSMGPNDKLYAVKKNGSQFLIMVSLSPVTYSGQQMAMAVVRDITSVMQNEETLYLIGSIIGNLREGVMLFKTEERKIVFSNQRLDELFGYAEGELTGKKLTVLLPENDEEKEKIVEEIISTLEKDKTLERNILYVRKDGTQFWIDTHVYSFSNETYGQVWVAVLQDISEKKIAGKEPNYYK